MRARRLDNGQVLDLRTRGIIPTAVLRRREGYVLVSRWWRLGSREWSGNRGWDRSSLTLSRFASPYPVLRRRVEQAIVYDDSPGMDDSGDPPDRTFSGQPRTSSFRLDRLGADIWRGWGGAGGGGGLCALLRPDKCEDQVQDKVDVATCHAGDRTRGNCGGRNAVVSQRLLGSLGSWGEGGRGFARSPTEQGEYAEEHNLADMSWSRRHGESYGAGEPMRGYWLRGGDHSVPTVTQGWSFSGRDEKTGIGGVEG